MNFSDIIGQDKIVKSLLLAKSENHIANAYIIDGTIGSGKELIARLFAMLLNCFDPSGIGGPCNICGSCKKALSSNHPNITFVHPTGATIKIAQIQQIISSVSKIANDRGMKTVILESADRMTVDAQNALLKTLEEPPDSTVFLLLTTNYSKLLQTIQSRCQILKLMPVKRELIQKHLEKKYSDKEKIQLAAMNAKGSVGRAEDIMADENFFTVRDQYCKLADHMLNGSIEEFVTMVEEVVTDRAEALELANFFLEYYRDIMLYQEMGEGAKDMLFYKNKSETIERHVFTLTHEKIRDIIDIILIAIKQIEQNVSFFSSIDNMIFGIREVYNGKGSRDSI